MMKPKFLLIFILWPLFFQGQVQLDQIDFYQDIFDLKEAQVLSAKKDERFENIKKKKFEAVASSRISNIKDEALWLKLKLRPIKEEREVFYIYSNMPYFSLFQKTKGAWIETKNGLFEKARERENKRTKKFLPLKIEPGKENIIYLHLENSSFSKRAFKAGIASEKFYYQNLQKEADYNRPASIFSLVYFSGLLMVFIFITMMYLLVRESLYFYYMFYVFFQLLYALFSYSDHPLKFINLSWYFPKANIFLTEPIQFLFIGFYIFFIYKLLEMGKYRILGRVLKIFGKACFIYAGFSLVLFLFVNPDLRFFVFKINRAIVLPLNLILIIWILLKIKHRLINYFIIAHLFFFAGAVVSVFIYINDLYLIPENIFYFRNSPDIIFQAGLMGEVICFSFALSLRVRLIQKEKEFSTKAYIQQLEKNERIQQQMNEELDKKVNQKTEELLQVYLDMERQRENELKLQFSQKIKEMETMVLRSQMNPHFLFNSMNAIKHLIMTGRSNDAMFYLDDFSYLLRRVLQNSKRETISAEEELEVLQLYLSMEKVRLGEDFNYQIKVDNEEELSMYPIPGLLLQPVVENAIWHGLIPSSKKEKNLFINFEIQDTLVISIRDNGIGRQQSLERKNDPLELHQSMGMKIIHNRLELFNHAQDWKIHLRIKDLKEKGRPSGTLVTFTYLNN